MWLCRSKIEAPYRSPVINHQTLNPEMPRNTSQLYKKQLQMLENKGFIDTHKNIEILVSAYGNINIAIEKLLTKSQK